MAVFKRTDRTTGRVWQAVVSRKGVIARPLKKSFLTQLDAERWAREQERRLDTTGLPLTQELLRKVTVGELVQRYIDEMTPTKGCSVSETIVLKKFQKRDICKLSLASISKQDGYKYRDERLKETWKPKGSKGEPKPVTPRTVRRELNSIQHIFSVAREEWGYSNLVNPFEGVKIEGSQHMRQRRLLKGELERIIEACDKCRGVNKIYVPLAIYLAIDTAMRESEIFNLVWSDIDFEERTIKIRKSKTDKKQKKKGRTIVLTYWAEHHLSSLKTHFKLLAQTDEKYKQVYADTAPVFVITQSAFSQSWDDVIKRAKIEADANGERLTFKDLRTEAGSRFDEAELTKAQNDRMMGHNLNATDMKNVYIVSELRRIREKLDRHLLSEALQQFEDEQDFQKKYNIGLRIEQLTQSRLPKEIAYHDITLLAWHDEEGFLNRTLNETIEYNRSKPDELIKKALEEAREKYYSPLS